PSLSPSHNTPENEVSANSFFPSAAAAGTSAKRLVTSIGFAGSVAGARDASVARSPSVKLGPFGSTLGAEPPSFALHAPAPAPTDNAMASTMNRAVAALT